MSSDSRSIVNTLKRIWKLLPAKRRKQLSILLILMLVSAFAEVISLGAIIPFLAVLTAPENATKIPFVASVLDLANFKNQKDLTLVLTTIFVLAAIWAAALRVFLLWASNRVGQATGYDLSALLFERTINQPYQYQIEQNSSTILSGIAKVDIAATVVIQCLNFVSATVLITIVLSAIVLIDPMVALVSIASFGSVYIIISLVTRNILKSNGEIIAREQTAVLKIVQECLGGIRDIILDGTQAAYVRVYKKADYPLRIAAARNTFIAGSPRFLMEGVGVVLIAFLALGLSMRADGITSSLPVLGALALGAQRLLPVLQQAYGAWSTILGSRSSLNDAVDLLEIPLPEDFVAADVASFPFTECIKFEQVGFRYASSPMPILSNINLDIAKGARVGIVGPTGSGKSTLMDLTMGLISPTEGRILIDGKPLEGTRLRSWQRTIAHVPQDLFLSDSSFAENIAIGVVAGSIDQQRVVQAAKQAQISEFIESCPNKYDEWVGERGLRLSGGQRQRIGIARALYKQASVLIFDEATSALDNETEKAIITSIEGLSEDLTIFIVAHRLSTLKQCTQIVELSAGGPNNVDGTKT